MSWGYGEYIPYFVFGLNMNVSNTAVLGYTRYLIMCIFVSLNVSRVVCVTTAATATANNSVKTTVYLFVVRKPWARDVQRDNTKNSDPRTDSCYPADERATPAIIFEFCSNIVRIMSNIIRMMFDYNSNYVRIIFEYCVGLYKVFIMK